MQLPYIARGRRILNDLLPGLNLRYIQVRTDSSDEKILDRETAADSEDSQPLSQQSTSSIRRVAYTAAATIFFFSILMAIGIYEVTNAKTQDIDLPRETCGNSTAEALALGCSFDQLLWAWLPPSCPHYANDEFLAAGDWKYYVDPHGREEAVGENWAHALDNHKDLWGERREHLTHCVYLFLSLGQVIRDGTGYSNRLVAYEHLEHCTRIVLESMSRDKDWYKMETSVGKVSYEESC